MVEALTIKQDFEKPVTLYLVCRNDYNGKAKQTDQVMDYFKSTKICFATVDLGNESLKVFNKSPVSALLDKLKIEYIPIDLKDYTIDFFFKELYDKELQVNEMLMEYLNMEDKASLRAEDLKFTLDLRIEDLKEKSNVLYTKLRPRMIVKRMKEILDACSDEKITFVHIGEEYTFNEIMKLMSEFSASVNVYYLHYMC